MRKTFKSFVIEHRFKNRQIVRMVLPYYIQQKKEQKIEKVELLLLMMTYYPSYRVFQN